MKLTFPLVGLKKVSKGCYAAVGVIDANDADAYKDDEKTRKEKLEAKKKDADYQVIDEVPYWTAKEHGKKYCLMYQVYTSPKYKKYGQEFFKGVDQRYTEYAKSLESKLGIPYEKITPLIFILIRASVHYALFEDEFYLKSQLSILKEALILFIDKYKGVNTK